jgi:phosphatidate cytidylyltransferase
MSRSDLGSRLLVAGIGIPAGIAVIYMGGWMLTGVLGAIALIGTLEVFGLARARGWRPFAWLGGGTALALLLWAGITGSFESFAPGALALLMALALVSLGAAVFRRGAGGDPLLAAGTTVFAVMYAALPLGFALLLRAWPPAGAPSPGSVGTWLLILPLVITWMGDTGAYFVGKNFGRHKLLPSVSPAKTVEGAVGGLLGAMGGAALVAVLFLGPESGAHLPPAFALLLGAIVGPAAQLGDLAESVLKREAGVKDSGTLLPGHGGVLDRFDAIYISVPLTWFLLPLVLR